MSTVHQEKHIRRRHYRKTAFGNSDLPCFFISVTNTAREKSYAIMIISSGVVQRWGRRVGRIS